MAPGTKFYIYSGGRWRELDLKDGHIDGRGQALFVYKNRGKIRCAKTGTVLSALRDLANGQKSAVRDGDRLLHKICEPVKQVKEITAPEPVLKTDASVQTSLPSQNILYQQLNKDSVHTRKRKHTTSTEEDVPTRVITNATVHTITTKPKQKRLRSNSSDIKVSESRKVIRRLVEDKVSKSELKRQIITSSGSDGSRVSNKNDSRPEKIISNQSKSKVVVSKKHYNSLSLKKSHKRLLRSKAANLRSHNNITRTDNYIAKSRKYQRRNDENKIDTSSDNQSIILKDFQKKRVDHECKEIFINEDDIELLRNYLINYSSDFDLLRFDQDDEYKKQFFYGITPLVHVERCPKIAEILQRDNETNISLKDFASQLGLRSVSEKTEPRRYNMRKLRHRSNLVNNSSNSEGDKENSKWNSNKTTNQTQYPEKHSHTNQKNQVILKQTSIDSESEDSEDHFKDTRKSLRLKTSNNTQDNKVLRKSFNKTYKETSISNSEDSVFIRKGRNRTKHNNLKHQNENDTTYTSDDSLSESTDSTDTNLHNEHINNKNNQKLVNTKEFNTTIPTKIYRNIDLTLDSTENSDVEPTNTNIKSGNRKTQRKNSSNTDAENRITKQNNKVSPKKDLRNDKHKHKKTRDLVQIVNNRNKDDTDSDNVSVIEDSQPNNIKKDNNKGNIKSKNISNVINEDKTHKDKLTNDNRTTQLNNNMQSKLINTNKSQVNKIINDVNNAKSNLVKTSDLRLSESIENIKSKIASQFSDDSRTRKKSEKTKPQSQPTTSYSMLEDHAIVAWVSVGGRPLCVNGNRIWRELEEQFFKISGLNRTWQSLRNRYLRHILPSLGSFSLPYEQVKRLRAAAATGEIKQRKQRRNSIYKVPERGALSRRPGLSRSSSEELMPPKRHKHDNKAIAKSPSPKRALRSSLTSPKSKTSPSYSDITRYFSNKHQHLDSGSNASLGSKENSAKREKPARTSSPATNITLVKHASASKTKKLPEKSNALPKTSPTKKLVEKSKENVESEVKKELRRSLRVRDSPVQVALQSTESDKLRTRKLFNPGFYSKS